MIAGGSYITVDTGGETGARETELAAEEQQVCNVLLLIDRIRSF